jgi:hypothetical protein
MVEQRQQVAHRLADYDAAGFITLEGASAATENLARLPLGQAQRLADANDVGRRQDALDAGLERRECDIGDGGVLLIENGLVAIGAPPCLRARN